ncbi:MAG: hypothetical protein INR70_14370 [Parafilimonas terrae]|nr:hypothetical protein [Parafilimonas terrae]
MNDARAAAWLLLAAGFATGALAQPSPAPGTDPAYDLLFQRVLREPANLDLSFAYARTASDRGDLEAAIGALERMVFYNPNLPRVKLELGVLYYRLGSYEMAKSYLESAIQEQDVPPEVRDRVAVYLTEINRRLSTNQFSFYGQAGLRYQTNATAGPSSPYVRAAGFDAVLDRTFVKKPDWNAFGLATVRHVYDFGNQRGDVWDSTLAVYYADQFRFKRFNLGLVEAQTGPRLALAPDAWPGLSIHPYGVITGVTLGDEPYLGAKGAGISVAMPIANIGYFEPFAEVRKRQFSNTPDFVNGAEQTGRIWVSGAAATGDLLAPDLHWQARLAYAVASTRRDYANYNQLAFDVGFPIEFTGFWGNRRWLVTPFAGVSKTDYGAPNAYVDPLVRRRECELRGGVQIDLPVWENVGLGTQVQYASVDASLRNYRNSNLSVLFGPTLRY